MEDKNNLYIVAIVGIVAVIGIVIMVIAGNNRATYASDGQITDEFGQVIAISNPTVRTVATTYVDYTPRIAYWSGKVNQHVNIATGRWETDPDGRSGATIDKLTYCKKWYPKTTSVVAYKMETIYGWRSAGNTGYYSSTKQSYKCVQGTLNLTPRNVTPSTPVPINSTVPTYSNCYDSDGGMNGNIRGYVMFNNYTVYDLCYDDVMVDEAICNNNMLEWRPINCARNCTNGRCV